MLDYATPKEKVAQSTSGSVLVAGLLAVSVACLAGSLAVSNGDVGLPLFLAAAGSALANVFTLLVFARRIPTALAVIGWGFIVLAAVALGALLVGSLLIATHLFTP